MLKSKDNLDDYIDALFEASTILNEKKPDYIVAPMSGSVPFIDVMNIVDSQFDPTKIVYMPASSRIENVNEVIRTWYYNFLNEADNNCENSPKIIGIDEVVSGSSVVRCLKNIDMASNKKRKSKIKSLSESLMSSDLNIAIKTIGEVDDITNHEHSYDINRIKRNLNERVYQTDHDLARTHFGFLIEILKDSLSTRYVYTTVGIEDSKAEGRRSKEYQELCKNGRITSVPVESILTMDIPDFSPPRFKLTDKPDKRGYVRYTPIVDSFVVTPAYLEFLQQIARRVGKNPDLVNPISFQQIMNSKKYL